MYSYSELARRDSCIDTPVITQTPVYLDSTIPYKHIIKIVYEAIQRTGWLKVGKQAGIRCRRGRGAREVQDQRPSMWTSARERVQRVLQKLRLRLSFILLFYFSIISPPLSAPSTCVCHPLRRSPCHTFRFSRIPSRRRQNTHHRVVVAVIATTAATIGTTAGPFYRLFYALEAAASALCLLISGSSSSSAKKIQNLLAALESAAREISSHFHSSPRAPPPPPPSPRSLLSLHFSSRLFHSNQVWYYIIILSLRYSLF